MYFILLLLPLAHALSDHSGYRVSITLQPPGHLTIFNIRGEDTKLLSDKDAAVFNLTKENIVRGLEKVSVSKPDNVFLRSPTESPDLYKSHNFEEVQRQFYLRDTSLINATSESVNKAVKEYTNNGTEKKQFEGNAFGNHLKVLSKHYFMKKQIPTIIKYEIETPTSAPNNYSYYLPVWNDTVGWGVDETKLTAITAKFDLNPGQTAKFIVNATEVTFTLKINYETTVKGDVVVQYGSQYERYRVLQVVLRNLSKIVLRSHEIITIRYLSGYNLQVVDVATGKDIPYTDFKYTD